MGELSVTYVNDELMKKLNLKYRGRDRYTDVLAFNMTEGKVLKGADGYMGDVIISLDAARRQAKDFGSTKKRELKLYLIHGMLHLLGYDDESRAGLKKMREKEEQLLNTI